MTYANCLDTNDDLYRRSFHPANPTGTAGEAAPAPVHWKQRLAAMYEAVLGWRARAAQRRMLLQLDDRMLKDIGLSRADAWAEAAKPIWRE